MTDYILDLRWFQRFQVRWSHLPTHYQDRKPARPFLVFGSFFHLNQLTLLPPLNTRGPYSSHKHPPSSMNPDRSYTRKISLMRKMSLMMYNHVEGTTGGAGSASELPVLLELYRGAPHTACGMPVLNYEIHRDQICKRVQVETNVSGAELPMSVGLTTIAETFRGKASCCIFL